ncbi:hypothetical protein GS475_02420, partial [Rhodococcus hoagii]|nr:hypothetical protein [Prescottella equi]
MTNVYPLRRTPKVTDPEQVSAIVVAGSGWRRVAHNDLRVGRPHCGSDGSDRRAIDGTSDGG